MESLGKHVPNDSPPRTVRVIPDPNGYQVEVIVEKEREDLPKPEAHREPSLI